MRPSKLYFHKHFTADMRDTEGRNCAADISCAYFKNYPSFRSKTYVGVDINKDVLNRLPEQKVGMPELHVEICDILNLNLPEKYKIDFIVSTHTFSHLEYQKRYHVLEDFVNLLQPDGNLLFNIEAHSSYHGDIDKLLARSFRLVKKVRYRNPLCKWYENHVVGSNGKYQPTSGLPYKIADKLFYWVEASKLFSFTGNMLYYYCEGKKA